MVVKLALTSATSPQICIAKFNVYDRGDSYKLNNNQPKWKVCICSFGMWVFKLMNIAALCTALLWKNVKNVIRAPILFIVTLNYAILQIFLVTQAPYI